MILIDRMHQIVENRNHSSTLTPLIRNVREVPLIPTPFRTVERQGGRLFCLYVCRNTSLHWTKMQSHQMQYPWNRYWVRNGESPILAGGFLVEPLRSDDVSWLLPRSNALSYSQIADVPCLVFLGDVGMGKTTTTQKLVSDERQRLHGTEWELHDVDLKRLHTSEIQRRVFDSDQFNAWARGERPLILFLDSLDECWRRVEELESIIVGGIAKHLSATSLPIRLRVICRSAEWRDEATAMLKELFGDTPKSESEDTSPADRVQIYTLAPLSAENIRAAAALHDIDGNELLQKIANKDAQALAAHPITFQMLLNEYLDHRDFPGTRTELYERGCRKLCEDRSGTPASKQQRITTPDQRLVISGRIAAGSVFTNHYLINADMEELADGDGVINASELLGNYPEVANGEGVAVNRESVRETLQTGLLTERTGGVQTWRHQSYAEFLGAWYLVKRAIPTAQVLSLITEQSANARRILPQMEETACWLTDLMPDIFPALVSSNADVLIRCELKELGETRRAELVENYLNLIRRNEAPDLDWGSKQRFARLDHPKLARQLYDVILDKTENPLVRLTAIEIAGFCNCRALGTSLIRVFLDSSEKLFRIRRRAGLALEALADDSIRTSLKAQATPVSLQDDTNDILGLYLRMLWPSHLTVTELLSHLGKRGRRDHFGAYSAFLTGLADSIRENDIPQFLDWLRDHKPFGRFGGYHDFPQKLVVRAFARLEDETTRTSLFRLLAKGDPNVGSLLPDNPNNVKLSSAQRRLCLNALVEFGLHVGSVPELLGIVLSAEEMPWLLSQYENAATHRKNWFQLICYSWRPENDEILERIVMLARIDKDVADLLIRRTSCELAPDERNWRKQQYLRDQEASATAKVDTTDHNSLSDKLRAALTLFEQGETNAFWGIVELLELDPKTLRREAFLNIQLSDCKGWQSLSDMLKADILRVAPSYLEQQTVDDAMTWDKEATYRPYCAAVQATLLLFDEDRQALDKLPNDLWVKWTPVLFAYFGLFNGNHPSAWPLVFMRAFQEGSSTALTSLERFLESYRNDENRLTLVENLGLVWRPEIESALLGWLGRHAIRSRIATRVFLFMLAHSSTAARRQLQKWFESRRDKTRCSIWAPAAAAALFYDGHSSYARSLLTDIKNDPAFGRSVARLIAWTAASAVDWMEGLSTGLLADLWDWLQNVLPSDPYFDSEDSTITADHQIADLRRALFIVLKSKGTAEACQAVVELMRRRPQDFWLGEILAEMRMATRRLAFKPPQIAKLLEMFSDPEKRLIRDAGDLHSLLLESIDRFEAQLHGVDASTELWNEIAESKKKIWSPKDEKNLSKCLKRHVESDLDKRGLIANREVEIRPRLGSDPAQLVDIFVQAAPLQSSGIPGSPVTVVIEVKCGWNDGVFEDMTEQLFKRYMRNEPLNFGIYLTAYFNCPGWNKARDTRKNTSAHTESIENLRATLINQAMSMSSLEKRVTARVLDARLDSALRAVKSKRTRNRKGTE